MNEENTIFGVAAAVGISIMWLVKDRTKDEKLPCKIKYVHPTDVRATRKEKLDWVQGLTSFGDIVFDVIKPDVKNNWINQTDNDWDSLLPLIDKDVKAGKSEEAVFKLFSRGVGTYKDDWVFDLSKDALEEKMRYFVNTYEASRKDKKFKGKMKIKWDEDLESYLKRGIEKQFDSEQIVDGLYRPFSKQKLYLDKHFIGRTYQWFNIFRKEEKNKVICFNVGSTNFISLASDEVVQQGTLLVGGGSTQCVPMFDRSRGKEENITDWALNQFQTHYAATDGARITKLDIFYYTYGVLHSPQYRRKYEQNLKREFPRLPFYADFGQWRAWGAALMDLHINYETQKPFALERKDLELTVKQRIKQDNLFADKANAEDAPFVAVPKTKLRADKTAGVIEIDSETTLTGVPAFAWEYKLGNRSALEWILDQYKEKRPQDATIAERFNHYKFADYKETVIDLLCRVCTVSVKTMEIVGQMPQE